MGIEGSEYLKRNIRRRKGLLEKLSGKEEDNEEEVPDITVKDDVFDKFLQRLYEKIRKKGQEQGLPEERIIERIKEANIRTFTIINRFAVLTKQPTTALVTALYGYPKKGAHDLLEGTYQEFLDKVKKIVEICQKYKVPISSITGMQNGLGIPDPEKLESFVDFCRNEDVDISSITGMQNGLGIPDLIELKDFIDFCRNENIPISSITGMQNGRGIPDLKKLKDFIDFCRNENIDISSITGMQNGRGIPYLEKLKEFIDFCRNENIDISSITGMQSGLGIPDLEELKEFIDWCKENNIDIRIFTSLQRGIPSLEEREKILQELKNKNSTNISHLVE